MRILREVVAVVIAVFGGVGLALDTLQITQLDFKWWPLIAFGISGIFVLWIIIDLKNQNKELENKKPSIMVTPECVEDLWYLDVLNNGEKGTFTAQLCVFPEENPNAWLEADYYRGDTPVPTMVAFKAYWVIMGWWEGPLYLYGSLPPTP